MPTPLPLSPAPELPTAPPPLRLLQRWAPQPTARGTAPTARGAPPAPWWRRWWPLAT